MIATTGRPHLVQLALDGVREEVSVEDLNALAKAGNGGVGRACIRSWCEQAAAQGENTVGVLTDGISVDID